MGKSKQRIQWRVSIRLEVATHTIHYWVKVKYDLKLWCLAVYEGMIPFYPFNKLHGNNKMWNNTGPAAFTDG